MGTATLDNNTTVLGPWLKDDPYNPSHYQISYTWDAVNNAPVEQVNGARPGSWGSDSQCH